MIYLNILNAIEHVKIEHEIQNLEVTSITSTYSAYDKNVEYNINLIYDNNVDICVCVTYEIYKSKYLHTSISIDNSKVAYSDNGDTCIIWDDDDLERYAILLSVSLEKTKDIIYSIIDSIISIKNDL